MLSRPRAGEVGRGRWSQRDLPLAISWVAAPPPNLPRPRTVGGGAGQRGVGGGEVLFVPPRSARGRSQLAHLPLFPLPLLPQPQLEHQQVPQALAVVDAAVLLV